MIFFSKIFEGGAEGTFLKKVPPAFLSFAQWGAAPSPAKPFLERKGLDPKELLKRRK
ncbi:MAG: hypothetical protein IJW97_01660 [Clostridia bacterium]|nr:hypothetical protein [Clostridia bacterium]